TINSYFYSRIYVSGRAGNIVRMEYYGNVDGNETLVGYMELVSYHKNNAWDKQKTICIHE
ncbi:MAG: hypothetical protein J7K95_02340, partial [Thermoplasmata archaeon]|nr:hypothetical protein [Thermoplasmata archaeon]